jgi:hypothetical protein
MVAAGRRTLRNEGQTVDVDECALLDGGGQRGLGDGVNQRTVSIAAQGLKVTEGQDREDGERESETEHRHHEPLEADSGGRHDGQLVVSVQAVEGEEHPKEERQGQSDPQIMGDQGDQHLRQIAQHLVGIVGQFEQAKQALEQQGQQRHAHHGQRKGDDPSQNVPV